MVSINENYMKLRSNYLFAEIAKRTEQFKQKNPYANIIKLGIGDVTRPLCKAVVEALHTASDEMSRIDAFRGYGPYEGYEYLREKIALNDYRKNGIDIAMDEIFVSDGAKSDTGNIQELFAADCVVAVQDPVYPVYVDSNVMAGRTGQMGENGKFEKLVYLPCDVGNGFIPELPKDKVDIIYLCSPNNPTGTALDKQQLELWVNYARNNESIIFYDAAYEAFIQQPNVSHSIYEINGARDVAIEFKSFSKTAGFTGTRCAYVVIPKNLMAHSRNGENVSINDLWMRHQSTKFNGVPYIIQRAAEATYSEEGQKQIRETIKYYMSNAEIIRDGLSSMSLEVYGGINAPYIWLKTPKGMTSWMFFDKLLDEANVVGTPGSGFGPSGEGYFRLTAFGAKEDVEMAIERMKARLCLDAC